MMKCKLLKIPKVEVQYTEAFFKYVVNFICGLMEARLHYGR
jgi:hypothetical protein